MMHMEPTIRVLTAIKPGEVEDDQGVRLLRESPRACPPFGATSYYTETHNFITSAWTVNARIVSLGPGGPSTE